MCMLDDGNDSREKNDAPFLYTGNGARSDKTPRFRYVLIYVFRGLGFPSHFPA